MITSILRGIAKTSVMDTADPRDGETGEGLSTEKQNTTSAEVVCVAHIDEEKLLRCEKNKVPHDLLCAHFVCIC